MRTFETNLLGYDRPVIELYGQMAIIDTGALVPMTILDAEALKKWDPELILEKKTQSGIGGTVYGDVYRLHNFEALGVNFENFEIFKPYDLKLGYQFLISATMFHGTDYRIDMADMKHQKMKVYIPASIGDTRNFYLPEIDGKIHPKIDNMLIGFDNGDIDASTTLIQNIDDDKKSLDELIEELEMDETLDVENEIEIEEPEL